MKMYQLAENYFHLENRSQPYTRQVAYYSENNQSSDARQLV